MTKRRNLAVLAVLIGLVGALLATTAALGQSAHGVLDLVLNDADGDYFEFDPAVGATTRQTLTSSACRLNSDESLVAFSASANSGTASAGLKDHVIGVKAKKEGNGTPCARINDSANLDGQTLTLQLAGPVVGDSLADYAQFGVKLKFGATARIDAYRGNTLVASGSASCTGGPGTDCGADSGSDRDLIKLGQVGGTALFNKLVIYVVSPEDGSVSLLDAPGYDTYLNLAADNTPPVITLVGDAAVTVEAGTTYTDAGATATDDFDGDLTSQIVTVNPVGDPADPGTYTVTYDVSDAAGNAAVQVVRTVNVVDTTKPVITLVGDAEVTIEAGSGYVDAGATALDSYEGDISGAIVVNNPVNHLQAGTYEVTYDVSDAAGNMADQVSRTVTVVDTTSPVITLAGDNPLSHLLGDPYVDPGASATDNSSDPLTVVVDASEVENATEPGTYTVYYGVSDSSGNEGTATRTVIVYDGQLACGDTVTTGDGIGAPRVEVTRNVIGQDCEFLKLYNLSSAWNPGVDQFFDFVPTGDFVAEYSMTVTWVAEPSATPVPATEMDFDNDGTIDGDLQWCDGTPGAPVLPSNGDPWCRVSQQVTVAGAGLMQVIEELYGTGDPSGFRLG